MIYKLPSPLKNHVRINFEIPSSLWADKISLAGDFNDWNYRIQPLERNQDGSWQTTLDLPTGKQYEFRYWVDGDWITDSNADGFSTTSLGIPNSIVDTCNLD